MANVVEVFSLVNGEQVVHFLMILEVMEESLTSLLPEFDCRLMGNLDIAVVIEVLIEDGPLEDLVVILPVFTDGPSGGVVLGKAERVVCLLESVVSIEEGVHWCLSGILRILGVDEFFLLRDFLMCGVLLRSNNNPGNSKLDTFSTFGCVIEEADAMSAVFKLLYVPGIESDWRVVHFRVLVILRGRGRRVHGSRGWFEGFSIA